MLQEVLMVQGAGFLWRRLLVHGSWTGERCLDETSGASTGNGSSSMLKEKKME